MFILFEVVLVLAICVPLILMDRKLKADEETERGRQVAGRRLVYKIIIAVVLFIVIAWNIYLSTYVNWYWFESKGYLEVFRKMLGLQWLMFGIAFLVSLVFVFINLKYAFKELRGKSSDTEVALLVSVLIALIMGGTMSGLWSAWMLNKYQVVTEIADPVFGRSISYYLFSLPWKINLLSWTLWLFVITFLILLGWFLSSGILMSVSKKKKKGVYKKSYKRIIRQLFILGALWAFVLVFKQGLNIDELVFSTSGVVVGAGYTDLHAGIFGIRVTRIIWIMVMIILLLSSVQFLRQKFYYRSDGKISRGRIFVVPAGIIALLLLMNVVLPGIQQATRVSPNELKAEMPYIEHNMSFTRRAYSIGPEDIEEREISIGREIHSGVIEANRQTLASIRLWDYRALNDYLREHQEIKPYYEFHDVDIDRYDLGGERREVMLAIRELETEQLDERALTWMNRTFKYTHGYGLTMAPVNEFLSGGKPNLFIKNIPSEVSFKKLRVVKPQIYYGELTDTFILTTPEVDEFDYPAGEENAYNNYDGNGGILLDTDWKKFCFAWRLNSHQMIFSPDINRETRVHLDREITTMVQKLAPWLKYDSDPYAVISDGRIKWIQDAYTVSSSYPYSATYAGSTKDYAGINYITNAVKVMIDAYDGSVVFYLFDEEDPIIRTYRKIFPSMFISASDMPPDIRAHLRYPEDLFTIQLEMYGTYQMRNVQVFYTKEDVWQRPIEKYHQTDDVVVEPYYITATLPGEANAQFLLMSPFTPREKNVLRSWICARSDGDNYGKLIVYKFPKGEEIKGPRMIESRIDQDSEMSQVLTLWDQKGSQVLRGNLMVVPLFFEDKAYLLYVEPVYLQAEGAKMPELKKVVVADQERIFWGDTFRESMEALISATPTLSRKADATADTALERVKNGDMSQNLMLLKAALKRYKTLQGEGRFSEAGSELEKIYSMVEDLMSGD